MQITWTVDDLQDINDAIATGAVRIRKDGREVEFRSLADLITIRDQIAGAVCPAPATGPRPVRRYLAGANKGICQ